MTEVKLQEVRQWHEGSGGDNSQIVLLQTEAVEVGDGVEGVGWNLIKFVGTQVQLHQVEKPSEGLQQQREI